MSVRTRDPWGGEFASMKGVELKLGGRTILDYVDLKVMEGELKKACREKLL